MARLVLAATLGASYGVLRARLRARENTPREFGGEEYLGLGKIRDQEMGPGRTRAV